MKKYGIYQNINLEMSFYMYQMIMVTSKKIEKIFLFEVIVNM